MQKQYTQPHGAVSSETRHSNSRVMELMSFYLNLGADTVTETALNEVAENLGVTRERAYAECLAAVCNVGVSRHERAFLDDYLVPMMHELDASVFENDPYYRTIRIPERKSGKWEFRQMRLAPCEAFVCDDFKVFEDGQMLPQLGFFNREFAYPAVLENGREWMTLMPNETVTTLPAVAMATGNVLTYGLGLGYFAFMASEKPDVTAVTVVERSADAIALFRQFILPQFPHGDKIKIVQSDAFDYAETEMPRGGFDFVFADIWHDVSDGRGMMKKFQEYEKTCPETRFSYWLEDTINCYLDGELWE